MSPQVRIYCVRCRRQLSPKAFDLNRFQQVSFKVCQSCIAQLGLTTMTATALLEDESMVKLLLQEREGGETEVETPVGFVDLVTDEYIIELKHVKSWKDGTKVLLFTGYLGDRKPRIHLFGGYTKDFKTLVETALNKLGITVTWERDPF